jgi:Zn-dependent protease
MLLAVALDNPITWAVIIGWIMSVVLHEFAHGLVAHLGGDYTIRQRGGLTLNPLQYVDPVFSIILPAVFVMMGGIPLPGGVTYIRMDLLRSRGWQSAVSAAGPFTNFLLFLALCLPFHQKLGWVDPFAANTQIPNWQMFCAGLAYLQMMAVVLNLIPIPPLDGFGILSPYMEPTMREKLTTPPASTVAFLAYFLVVWKVPQVIQWIYDLVHRIQQVLGFDYFSMELMRRSYNLALFGHTD